MAVACLARVQNLRDSFIEDPSDRVCSLPSPSSKSAGVALPLPASPGVAAAPTALGSASPSSTPKSSEAQRASAFCASVKQLLKARAQTVYRAVAEACAEVAAEAASTTNTTEVTAAAAAAAAGSGTSGEPPQKRSSLLRAVSSQLEGAEDTVPTISLVFPSDELLGIKWEVRCDRTR